MYVYAVNIGGSGAYPPVVQGVTFTSDNITPGVTIALGGTASLKGEYWGTKPEYGATENDNWLEALMHATALSYGTGPQVDLAMNVTTGRTYELHLLISENVLQNDMYVRHFDIAVEGMVIANEFTPLPATANWTNAPHTGYVITYHFVARRSVVNVTLNGGSTPGDPNPVLQAFMLKDVTSEPSSPHGIEIWANSYGLTGADVLPEADVEPDGLDNLMEYAFGGNPTNDDTRTIAPVAFMETQDGTNWFYHVHVERTNDPWLMVTLAAGTNLADESSWWNTNDLLRVGEGASGNGFITVTNRTATSAGYTFIQINIEYSEPTD
jgi:hypothetical protein